MNLFPPPQSISLKGLSHEIDFNNVDENLSYIYLGYFVCVSQFCCGTLSYSFSFSNQTDQGDKTEGLEREGLEMERLERDRSEREGVKRLFIV
jgi:hypothetical protein